METGHSESYGDSTQLLYLRARYYNPADGRFLSRDTWGGDNKLPITLNKFVYANSNPVVYVDPSGHIVVRYDRQAATNYANQYALNPNSQVYGVMGDNDCTNFVSQALRAGGLKDEDNWYFKSSSTWQFASSGSAWRLTDDLYDYLVNKKNFQHTDISGDDYLTGYIPNSPDSIPFSLLSKARKGDVVFYRQDASDYVQEGGTYNHAAFVVGWGHLTDFILDDHDDFIRRDTSNTRAPRVVDHSGPLSSFGAHSINDTKSSVNKLVIVHIPDSVYYHDVWNVWGCS